MKPDQAITALSALAQEQRLALFRQLVQVGPEGMAAGALADLLGVPNSSLSFHLAQLTGAGLIRQRRAGRSLIYSADFGAMTALIDFLLDNCCEGAACAPVVRSARCEEASA
ncbi:MAG: helix-turn-helix transcriptional regulator [Sphingomonadales bacterium]|nr:helix-turn-helix transcriptional regulator [Sphingomonadales bacterium]